MAASTFNAANGLTLINGTLADSVPVSDRGLLYGDGLFETIRLRGGNLVLLPAHLHRLLRGCETLGIHCDMADMETQLRFLLSQLVQHKGVADADNGVVKIMITRGDGGRGYMPPPEPSSRIILQFHPLPPDYEEFSRQGIACLLCQQPVSENPALAGMKHLNRLDQVMGSRELQQWQQRLTQGLQEGQGLQEVQGFQKGQGLQEVQGLQETPGSQGPSLQGLSLQEGLMCNSRGQLIEGTKSNVFAVIEDRLCTPDLNSAGVNGIMRETLLAWWQGQGVEVAVRDIDVEELSLATELFICNSVLGIWPVGRLYHGRDSEPQTFLHTGVARTAQRWIQTHLFA